MRFAYADPPYLGCCGLYDHFHPDGKCWDHLDTHEALIDRMMAEFPDGWALSASAPSLPEIAPLVQDHARIGVWVKPFAIYKPNVNPAYAWEPVFWHGGRKRDRTALTVRDWCAANVTLERGTIGAKPYEFCWWVFDLLGVTADDEFTDVFPGSGAVTEALDAYLGHLPTTPDTLWGAA